jgi:hypothetical protein
MPEKRKLPFGHLDGIGQPVRTAAELGILICQRRAALALRQLDIAGLGNTGNRFISELENGKETVQLQKTLDLLGLLGLEVIVRPKSARHGQ